MIVIGIDPGIATTGFGIVKEESDGSLIVIDYGVILTDPNLTTPSRLLDLYHKLLDLLSLHRPNSAAVERLFFQKNVRTALTVGQALGVIQLGLANSNLPISEYTPLEVKQAVAGYGGADKHQVQQMVRAILKLTDIPRPDDAADALAIAITHIHSYQMKTLADQ